MGSKSNISQCLQAAILCCLLWVAPLHFAQATTDVHDVTDCPVCQSGGPVELPSPAVVTLLPYSFIHHIAGISLRHPMVAKVVTRLLRGPPSDSAL